MTLNTSISRRQNLQLFTFPPLDNLSPSLDILLIRSHRRITSSNVALPESPLLMRLEGACDGVQRAAVVEEGEVVGGPGVGVDVVRGDGGALHRVEEVAYFFEVGEVSAGGVESFGGGFDAGGEGVDDL